MAALAMRFIAGAGMLVGALMMGDSSTGLAAADPGGVSPAGADDQFSNGVNNEGVGAQTTMAGVPGEPEPQAAGVGGPPPESSVGSGREGSSVRDDNALPGRPGSVTKGSNVIVLIPMPFLEGMALPVPAVPNGRGGDLAQDTATVMSTLESAVSPYLPSPPEPEPSPSFRQEAEPEPVSASGGDGSEATAFGGDLPVLEAPVIAAPVPGVVSTVPPAGATGGAPRTAGTEAVASGSGSTGVRLHGASEVPPAGTAAPVGAQPQRLGYAEYLRTPGLPGLFGAALPGLAGMALLTLGGTGIGYRQAKTGRMVRSTPAARMLR
jgi:hypothetical protein